MFSATLPPEALEITRKFMNKPVSRVAAAVLVEVLRVDTMTAWRVKADTGCVEGSKGFCLRKACTVQAMA